MTRESGDLPQVSYVVRARAGCPGIGECSPFSFDIIDALQTWVAIGASGRIAVAAALHASSPCSDHMADLYMTVRHAEQSIREQSMKNSNYILAAALMAVFSSGALAEDATLEEIQVNTTAEKPGLHLKKKNTTASRLGLTAQETPASIEVLDGQTIRQRGDSTVKEAISRTTGITDISNLGTGIAFSARGFTGNNSVAQAEDGIRLLTAASTLTYPSDTWGYEKFEVLRGPASVLFGDASVGGIINSIRKAPSRESTLEALVGAGTRGEYRAGVGGTGAIGEIGAFRIDASTTGGNGYVDHGHHDSKKLMTNFLFTPTENLRLNITYDHSEESPMRYTGIPLRDGRVSYGLRKENYNISNSVQDFDDDRLRGTLEWDINDNLKLTNVAYWFNARRHWRNVEYFSLDSVNNTVDRFGYTEIRHKQKQLGDRLELASNSALFGHQNRWAIGYEIARVDFRYFDNFYDEDTAASTVPVKDFDRGAFQSDLATLLDFTSRTTQQALFVEDAFDLTDKLKLSAGLRQDWINVKYDSRLNTTEIEKDYSPFSYRLGLVFQATTSTSLYGQYSKGTDPVTSLVTLRPSNSAFKLTKANQAEIGIKHQLPEAKGEVSLAIYHIEKDNILTRVQGQASQNVQGGSQSSRGIELSGTFYPSAHWRTDVNAAILDARYDDFAQNVGGTVISRNGNTPYDVPEKVANAWLYYQQANWEAGIGARLVGKRYADPANSSVMAGYTVYDANVAWKINPKTTVRLNLRNITDKLFVPVSYDTQQFIVGQPRAAELIAEFSY